MNEEHKGLLGTRATMCKGISFMKYLEISTYVRFLIFKSCFSSQGLTSVPGFPPPFVLMLKVR